MYLAIFLKSTSTHYFVYLFLFILFLLHICDTFFPSQSATHLFTSIDTHSSRINVAGQMRFQAKRIWPKLNTFGLG